MAWSWHFTPSRIYTDKRFLRLSKTNELASGLLLRLYYACDRSGRGPHDDLALAARTGLVAADDILERMDVLYATGMVLRSEDGEAWELERYDEDAPRDVKRDRPPSEFPPGKQNGPREKSGEHPGSIRGASGESPEVGREESAHARARAAARALPPARETRQGKAGKREGATSAPLSEPTPAASTDARASSAPVEPDQEPRAAGASPPALGGAGEAPCEATEGEQQHTSTEPEPEPPPRPRPRLLTRAEEAERVRALREQLASVEGTAAAAGGAP